MWVGSIRYAVLGLALATALLSDCSTLRTEFAASSALPPTPAPIPSKRSGEADANGITIHYAVYGKGPPALLLHGGLANADYWGHQIPPLARRHTVIAMDSRGHGRSTRDARPLGYDLMADDAIALLDVLKMPKVDVVGWSDGATVALDLAMRYPDRVRKIFAFAAATATSGEKYSAALNPNFVAFVERTRREYEAHSATPTEYGSFVIDVLKMWATEPNWSDAQLKTIAAPVLVVEGAEDEAIKREHTEYIASVIPRAELLVLPNTSHFAFLQNPDLFNRAILRFLGDR
jgi:pimeloyl-ACP methyl ester carboxylesterase